MGFIKQETVYLVHVFELMKHDLSIDHNIFSLGVKFEKYKKKSKTRNFIFEKINILIGVFIFAFFYTLPILSLRPTEHTCLAIVFTVVYILASDATQFYVASYLIPILSVWLQIGFDSENGCRIDTSKLAQMFAYVYMSPEIFTHLMSVTVLVAFDKLKLNTYFWEKVILHFSPYPSTIIFTTMVMNFFLGSFFTTSISTTLVLSLVYPLIKFFDRKDQFSNALLFGIAWSGNCGAMASRFMDDLLPITSLQYAILSIPLAIIICGLEFLYLYFTFNIPKTSPNFARFEYMSTGLWTWRQYSFIIIELFSFLFISIYDSFEFTGHEGIVCLVPIVLIYGSGILTTNDFNSLNWTPVAIAGGSLALNMAMKISGLFDFIVDSFFSYIEYFQDTAKYFYCVVFVAILSSIFTDKIFLINKLLSFWFNDPTMIFLSILMVHVSQILIISTFSNIIISSIVFKGETYIKGYEMFKHGLITTTILALCIVIIGSFICKFIYL